MSEKMYMLGTKIRVETMAGAMGVYPNKDANYCGAVGDGPLRDTPAQYEERAQTYLKAARVFERIIKESEDLGGY